jgi:SAM-dependent MidA family methyltransferase
VVERSRSATEAVVELVPDALAVESVSQVGATNAVVIMNEVLDNVPAALVRRKAEGWAELAVDRDGDSLVLCEVDARQEVAQWADTFLSTLKPGNLGTVQLEAQRLVTEIFASFDGVGVCVIDYGGSGSDLAMLREEDVVRTYKRQRSGFDFLSDPGGTDITVDVNTDAIVSVAGRLGATTAVVSQRDFLIANGAKDELDRFATQESAAARDGDILRQLKARSDAVGLRALLEPAGFGSFRVVTMVREAGVPEASMEE